MKILCIILAINLIGAAWIFVDLFNKYSKLVGAILTMNDPEADQFNKASAFMHIQHVISVYKKSGG